MTAVYSHNVEIHKPRLESVSRMMKHKVLSRLGDVKPAFSGQLVTPTNTAANCSPSISEPLGEGLCLFHKSVKGHWDD